MSNSDHRLSLPMPTTKEDRFAEIERRIREIDAKVASLQHERHQLQEEWNSLCEIASSPPAQAPPVSRGSTSAATGRRSRGGGAGRVLRLNVETAESPNDFDIYHNAKMFWSIEAFRPRQLDIIRSTLEGVDVVGILSTGAGKSLCFQLPGVVQSEGITVVISPLLSLIYDQVEELTARNIGATFLTGNVSKSQQKQILDHLESSTGARFLYVTPEKVAKSKLLMRAIENVYRAGRLVRIVIDEAHCCLAFGHDFRPDYKNLGVLKRSFPKTPVIALTATCPFSLIPSLMDTLGISGSRTRVYSGSLNRPNLNYSVVARPSSDKETIAFIDNFIRTKHSQHSGIVYCLTKKDCETVAVALQELGHSCSVYHSEVDVGHKESIHTRWKSGEIKIVVATIAFGMGINHLHVRFVIHHSPSKSLEGYYQESGRAGRDGQPADCLLLYRGQDVSRLSSVLFGEYSGLDNLKTILRYCNAANQCRRTLLFKYFNDQDFAGLEESLDGTSLVEACNGACDFCSSTKNNRAVEVDISKYVYVIGAVLTRMPPKLTVVKLIAGAKGRVGVFKGPDRSVIQDLKHSQDPLLEYPLSKTLGDAEVERIIVHLLVEGYIQEDFQHTAYTVIPYLIPAVKLEQWISECRSMSAFAIRSELSFHLYQKATCKRSRSCEAIESVTKEQDETLKKKIQIEHIDLISDYSDGEPSNTRDPEDNQRLNVVSDDDFEEDWVFDM